MMVWYGGHNTPPSCVHTIKWGARRAVGVQACSWTLRANNILAHKITLRQFANGKLMMMMVKTTYSNIYNVQCIKNICAQKCVESLCLWRWPQFACSWATREKGTHKELYIYTYICCVWETKVGIRENCVCTPHRLLLMAIWWRLVMMMRNYI